MGNQEERIKELESEVRTLREIMNRMLESDLIRKEVCKSLRKEINELNFAS